MLLAEPLDQVGSRLNEVFLELSQEHVLWRDSGGCLPILSTNSILALRMTFERIRKLAGALAPEICTKALSYSMVSLTLDSSDPLLLFSWKRSPMKKLYSA
jgi:hypothetical protein